MPGNREVSPVPANLRKVSLEKDEHEDADPSMAEEEVAEEKPYMVDVFSGPNAPLAVAFEYCGWRADTLDKAITGSDDLNNPVRQSTLADQVKRAAFVSAAFDCSTKSRAREIPRNFGDGSRAPEPLRSQKHPEGLPSIKGEARKRVDKDNEVTDFMLGLLEDHDLQGGGSVRENPLRSLHWWLAKEQEMMASGRWKDKTYAACVLHGARRKQQRLRHNIGEIDNWPPMDCKHIHDPQEWEPHEGLGGKYWPSREEAEYTAALAFYIAISVSWWAMRRGYAKMKIPKLPRIENSGDKRPWLKIHPKALREWAMLPMALGLGIDPPHAGGIPVRRSTDEVHQHSPGGGSKDLPPDHVYVGQGRGPHELQRSKWASPFVPGSHGTATECVCFYLDHLRKTELLGDIHELLGKTLVSDQKPGEPCIKDALAAEVYASNGKTAAQDTEARSEAARSFETSDGGSTRRVHSYRDRAGHERSSRSGILR